MRWPGDMLITSLSSIVLSIILVTVAALTCSLFFLDQHGVTAEGHSSGTPPPFSFYSESPSGRYTPRAVLLDCEDDATSTIRRCSSPAS